MTAADALRVLPAPPLTAHVRALEGDGLPQPRILALLDLTAGERHSWRVHATMRASVVFVAGEERVAAGDADRHDLRVAADMIRLDLAGSWTRPWSRMTWAQGLGSGRWNSGDAAAYAAAAREAVRCLDEAAGWDGGMTVERLRYLADYLDEQDATWLASWPIDNHEAPPAEDVADAVEEAVRAVGTEDHFQVARALRLVEAWRHVEEKR